MTDIPSIGYTGDFQRVAALPRRVWSPDELSSLASSLTEILRRPPGPCPPKPCTPTDTPETRQRDGLCVTCAVPLHLRGVQALGLHDAGTERGLFGSIGVGEGKTLLTLMIPIVLGVDRSMLLLPGGLIEKTERDRLALGYHWRLPNGLRTFSYDALGRVDYVDELENFKPEALICDEVHRLKNKRAAVTRRVARWMHDHPETPFFGVSGTVMTESIKDFAHILLWALKWGAPVPTDPSEIEEWAEALDVGGDAFSRRRPGALMAFAAPEDRVGLDEVTAARRAFRRRMTETAGVVATIGEGEHIGAAIYVRTIRHKVKPITEENFKILRGNGTPEYPGWLTPDGWEIMSGAELSQHAQELALGLHYVWNPRPPDDWRFTRSAWKKYARETLARSRTYDSEKHLADALDAGALTDRARLAEGRMLLAAWRELEPTFDIHIEPVWHDHSALEACRDWMHAQGKAGGIVWTSHGLFAERLAQFAGVSYYGAAGLDAAGRYIEDATPGSCIIASIDANREGKNLQRHWSRNLLACPPRSAAWIEQVIARTHRTGQPADEVIVDILIGCRENFDNILAAFEGARAIQDTTGKKQKLLLATATIPTEREIDALHTYRWVK